MASLKYALLALKGPLGQPFKNCVAEAIRESLEYVLDGRPDWSRLEAVEKCMLGVKIEKRLLAKLGLPTKKTNPDMRLDTQVMGVDMDIKTTTHNNWMIPPEAVGHHMLLIQTNVYHRDFSVGLFEAHPWLLTQGVNRDCKVQISKKGKPYIEWLYRQETFD